MLSARRGNSMHVLRGGTRVIVAATIITFCWPATGRGQFIYVNNNIASTNTVSALKVGVGGALSSVTGSPFATGGAGSFSFDVDAIDVVVNSGRLYVANASSDNISAFTF